MELDDTYGLQPSTFPYLSIDHLKMGINRSGNTNLAPKDDDALTDELWPFQMSHLIAVRTLLLHNLAHRSLFIISQQRRATDFIQNFIHSFLLHFHVPFVDDDNMGTLREKHKNHLQKIIFSYLHSLPIGKGFLILSQKTNRQTNPKNHQDCFYCVATMKSDRRYDGGIRKASSFTPSKKQCKQ